MKCWSIFMLATLVNYKVECLDNGLARTPPMGWLDWERFRCNTDCVNDPDNCIGENLFKTMADLIVKEGYKDAGYEYVDIDDCWLDHNRDSHGRLQPDASRFPSGMKSLADYIHSKGLKLGIYEDFGTKTCAGYPGSEYYLQIDAQTFAGWGVDLLKFDGCNSDPHGYDDEYPPMGFFMNMTGRHMVLSCEYAVHQIKKDIKPNYPRLSKACNLARNGGDVQDSWESVQGIINQYAKNDGDFVSVAGPGFWNDPDMLVIGDFGLSNDQERIQMAMWCIMASPLMMSVDLRNIRPSSRALLQNKGAISINQDAMGKQGTLLQQNGNIQIWTRPILPEGSFAFVFLNLGDDGTPKMISIKLSDMGMKSTGGYQVYEVFDNTNMGKMMANSTINQRVNPTGVFFGKATAIKL